MRVLQVQEKEDQKKGCIARNCQYRVYVKLSTKNLMIIYLTKMYKDVSEVSVLKSNDIYFSRDNFMSVLFTTIGPKTSTLWTQV